MILSERDWEEARAAGHLLLEHVLLRMRNMIHRELGTQGGSIGFDEHGFVKALIAESFQFPGGVKLCVYPNDHPPPHVHVKLRKHPKAKIRISLEDGEFLKGTPQNLASKLLGQSQALVVEHRVMLIDLWESYHGGPVIVA